MNNSSHSFSSSPITNNTNRSKHTPIYIHEEDESDLSSDLISTFKQTPMYDIINRLNPINAIKSSASTMDICR